VKVSIVIPSKGCAYLPFVLRGLKYQTTRPSEIILVTKECHIGFVENLCRDYSLPCILIEQRLGYFTHALNIGKREARGDIIIFTDDDVIPLSTWIEKYIKLHTVYRSAASISSRDIYIDLNSMKILPTSDDEIIVRMYRWFVRPWLEQPHPLLKNID
jgi:glycosyltransferase involved in cell wall biosynthesis